MFPADQIVLNKIADTGIMESSRPFADELK